MKALHTLSLAINREMAIESGERAVVAASCVGASELQSRCSDPPEPPAETHLRRLQSIRVMRPLHRDPEGIPPLLGFVSPPRHGLAATFSPTRNSSLEWRASFSTMPLFRGVVVSRGEL